MLLVSGRRTQAIVAGSSTLSRISAKQPYLPGKSVQVCCCDLATVELKSNEKVVCDVSISF